MASKKTQEGFDFLVSALKANKDAEYADLKKKADEKGLKVFPIMFGRAKTVLGLIKAKPRGSAKAAKTGAKKAGKKARKGPAPKRGRPAGGGASKSDRIRELLRAGEAPVAIAKKVGCTTGLVYNVKNSMGRGSGRATLRRGPGRPPKAARSAEGLGGIIEALQQSDRERGQLLRALEQIRGIVEGLE